MWLNNVIISRESEGTLQYDTQSMALGTNNIKIQQFCNNQYLVWQSYKDTSRYMSNDEYKMTEKVKRWILIHAPNWVFLLLFFG